MWTVSERYQDGRGFTCVDVMFNGKYRWAEVSGCPIVWVGYDEEGRYTEVCGEWATWKEAA